MEVAHGKAEGQDHAEIQDRGEAGAGCNQTASAPQGEIAGAGGIESVTRKNARYESVAAHFRERGG